MLRQYVFKGREEYCNAVVNVEICDNNIVWGIVVRAKWDLKVSFYGVSARPGLGTN